MKEIIIRMVCWISFITFIIMVIWRIFGNSPTNLEIIIPILVIMGGQVVKNTVDLKGGGIHQLYNEKRLLNIETQINRIPQIEIQINKIPQIEFDIKEIKEDIKDMKGNIEDMKDKFDSFGNKSIKIQLDRIEKNLVLKKKTF